MPVWYDYDGQAFIVTTFENRVKVRNVRQNPNVTLCVVDTVSYGEPLVVKGTAQVIEEGAQEATRTLAIRYLGEEEGNRRAAAMAGQRRVIIRITPDKIL